MVITKLIGGLGNQMFQYATGRALALRLGAKLCIDRSGFEKYKVHRYGLGNFSIQAVDSLYSNKHFSIRNGFLYNSLRKLNLIQTPVLFKEKSYCFDPQVLKLKDGTCLDGYWQSEYYFNEFADTIRRDFKVAVNPAGINKDWLNRIKAVNSVSLHVRRGDYITNANANAVHGTCDLEYYHRSTRLMLKKFGSDIEFFVFSDDLDWAKQNLDFGEARSNFVYGNDAHTNYEDLRLMSSCCHHIIANSTFSWWGAWLNPDIGKTVVAPAVWFRDSGLNDKDLIPKSWLRI